MSRGPTKVVRLAIAAAILSSCIGCDQLTKQLATSSLQGTPSRSLLGDTIRLEYARNSGGFLSFGSELSDSTRFWVFIGFNSLAMLLVAGVLIAKWNVRLVVFVPLLYVLAGGIGNLIDRVSQQGQVTDFLNVGVGSLRSGIFNVADVAVTFGALVLLLTTRPEKSEPKA